MLRTRVEVEKSKARDLACERAGCYSHYQKARPYGLGSFACPDSQLAGQSKVQRQT